MTAANEVVFLLDVDNTARGATKPIALIRRR